MLRSSFFKSTSCASTFDPLPILLKSSSNAVPQTRSCQFPLYSLLLPAQNDPNHRVKWQSSHSSCPTLAIPLSAVASTHKPRPAYKIQALFLPEASDYISHSALETLSLVQPASTSPYVLGLQSLAKASHLAINAGIHEPGLVSEDKIRNTSIWIDENGEIVQRYQKLHLFDMDLGPGGPVARESEYVPFPLYLSIPFHRHTLDPLHLQIRPSFRGQN